MNHEDRFDEAIRSIREAPIDPAVEAAAAARVRERLAAHEPIRGCAGFQALIPAYLAGGVPADRALLVKDHLHECVACRRFYDHARGKSAPKVAEIPARRAAGPWRWAIAAAATLTVGLAAWEGFNRIPSEERGRATLQSSLGTVLLVDGHEVRPLKSGEVIPAGASIRTPKDATALVRLADGSLIESRQRSEFSVAATRRDLNVQLARGSLIVEAAKQRSGHLYVTPRDCRVAVTGTVFSVSSGVKGSRVSVVEGQVEVEHDGAGRVLRPGQQYATSDSMRLVSVRDDIAWSARFTQHVALMQEVAVLGKAMEQVSQPAPRYSSKLMDMLPADTAVYASIPNLGRSLEDALRVFRQRLAESPVLRQWWQKEVETGSGPSPEDLVVKIRRVSDYLGDEIV
ncbi:MAG: FecR domain-containing protein, partial [Bryobacteraceae bacterium]